MLVGELPEPYRSLLEDHPPHHSLIRHGIYLGDLYDAYHVLAGGLTGFEAVLNMAALDPEETPYPDPPPSLAYCHLPLVDFQYCDPRYWHEAADFIDRHKAGILVHCLAGISRSPTAVLAYLAKYERVHPFWGLRQLRRARPQVRPASELLQSLGEFRKSLRWA